MAGSEVNWHSLENVLFLNPRMPDLPRKQAENAWSQFTGEFESHLGLLTSGTSGQAKIVLLKKSAFLAAARGVNEHLQVRSKDIWFKALPSFHVGGLSIYARAELSGSQVFEYGDIGWSAKSFAQALAQSRSTLISLVPTQLFDLIGLGLPAPQSLRASIIGGGALHPELYEKARALGWNPLPSYGMTESCALLACAEAESGDPEMLLLPHIQARTNPNGIIELAGSSLLSAYILFDESGAAIQDPKDSNGWFATGDHGTIDGRQLKVSGRATDFIKIGGESVSLSRLESVLARLKLAWPANADCALVAAPDARLGHAIHLLANSAAVASLDKLTEAFNAEVLPFERIRKAHIVEALPRTSLGKLIVPEAQQMLTHDA